MFSFLFISSKSSQYQDLILKAKSNANRKMLRASQNIQKLDDIQPGTYSNNGFTYTLRYPVTGDLSSDILGYAMENSTLAIVKKSAETTKLNKVFSNSASQKVYRLKSVLETENNVDVYQVEKIEPLDLISNLQYNASKDSMFKKEINTSFRWSPNDDPFVLGRPEYSYSVDTINIGAGAYISSNVLLDFDLSLKSLSLTAAFRTKVIFGAILNVSEYRFIKEQIELFNSNIDIPNSLTFSVFGVSISLNTNLYARFVIDNISLHIPTNINIYRGYILNYEKNFSISTDDFITSPSKYSLEPVKSQASIADLAAMYDKSVFEFKPKLDFGFNISLTAGTKAYIGTSFNIEPAFPFNFAFDKEKCSAPYLYGSITPSIQALFTFDGFKALGYQVVKPIGKLWNVMEPNKSMMCLVPAKVNDEL